MVNENEVITIKLDDIIPNRFQPREVFDEQALNELAESIKLHGVIQPIIVRPVDNKYEIIAGERRYKASVLAGKTDIPAIVKVKDDKESSIIAFIENSQRKNVSPIEEAKTCERLLSNNDMTQEQLAKQLGMSQSTLANKLRLLTLPVEVQDALLNGEISERHARSLLSVKDTKEQLSLLGRIKEEKLTVRELEGEIKNMFGNEGMNSQGLYDLPGAEDVTAKSEDFDLSKYEINPVSEVRQEDISIPTLEEKKEEPAAPEVKAEAPKQNSEFLSFLNDFDDSKVAAPLTTPEEEKKEEAPETPTLQDNSFDSFLSSFNSNSLAESIKKEEEKKEEEVPETSSDTSAFDDFLKKYENTPVAVPTPNPEVPVAPETPKVEPISTGGDFDDFLKKYEEPVTPSEEASIGLPQDDQFANFLNTADTDDIASKYLNPVTEVVEKPQYVENSPTYVDLSKPKSYDTVDEIISKLKEVTDEIKKSKYKVTTDEVNFDDIYQIKITIDKRNFL